MHEDNVTTVLAFLSLATQWRVHFAPTGALLYQGLDYAAIPAVLSDLMGLPRRKQQDVFRGLRVMEGAAIAVRNRRPDDDE